MTAWLAGGLWAAALVLTPFVGRLIYTGRRHRHTPPVVWDRDGDPWDRDRHGTYHLRGENSDHLLEAWTYDEIDQAFGPVTLEPPTGQDPTS